MLCDQPRLLRAQATRVLYIVGVLSLSFSLTASGGASARDPQSGIIGDDDRRAIEELSGPWSAIGQVNTTGYRRTSRCTGSLVATNLVITAAHCVMDPSSGKPLFPSIRYTFWRVSEDLAGLVIRPRGVYIFRLNISPWTEWRSTVSRSSSTRILARRRSDRVEGRSQ